MESMVFYGKYGHINSVVWTVWVQYYCNMDSMSTLLTAWVNYYYIMDSIDQYEYSMCSMGTPLRCYGQYGYIITVVWTVLVQYYYSMDNIGKVLL